jgi:ABC-2 type transport system permease protein
MSLWLLYTDELKGYLKSRVLLVLWVGLPVAALLLHFIPSNEEVPLASLVAIAIASIGGTISSVMISTTIVNELHQNVYILFLVRPIRRYELLLAKFLAVYTTLIVATGLSIAAGMVIDILTKGLPPQVILEQTFESIALSLAAMGIATAAGVLIGSNAKSVAVAAILSVYLGNQLSLISVLPGLFFSAFINPILFSVAVGVTASAALLAVAMLLFNKKQF